MRRKDSGPPPKQDNPTRSELDKPISPLRRAAQPTPAATLLAGRDPSPAAAPPDLPPPGPSPSGMSVRHMLTAPTLFRRQEAMGKAPDPARRGGSEQGVGL